MTEETTALHDPSEALQRAVRRVGSQSAMARLLGLSQAAVWKWLSNDRLLPAEHVLTVERATGISRHELRPDIYPPAADDRAVAAQGSKSFCDPARLSQRGAA